ncbi:MAG: response regulator transcription factor [bacterium]|jgi:DNA-binding NarL/FixJ family response regulator
MIRLIVTDDHPVIRNGIKAILESVNDIQIVAEVSDGEELMQLLESTEADIILMDINMPNMNGIEATKIVNEKYPHIKVITFSQYDEKRFVKQAVKSGASGYMLKNTPADEFTAAIRMVHQGGMYFSPALPNVFGEKPKPRSNYLFPDLTAREKEVLALICREKNTQEIADELFISYNTVESHRANLLLKVGVKNTAGLVKWAIENEIL